MDAVTPIRGVARQVGKDGATVFKVKAGRQVSGALTKSGPYTLGGDAVKKAYLDTRLLKAMTIAIEMTVSMLRSRSRALCRQ